MKKVGHFREIGKDMVTYGLMSALSRMGNLLLLPILTRVFSTGEYGTVDIIATFVSLISTTVRFALPSAVRRYFREESDASKRARLISTILIFCAVAGLLIILCISCFARPLAGVILNEESTYPFILLACWIAYAKALVSLPETVLRMERRIVAYNLINIITTVSFVLLSLFFVLEQERGVQGVFLGHLISGVLALCIALVITRTHLRFKFSFDDLKRVVKFSLPIYPSWMISWGNAQIDRLLLLMLVGLGGVGLFGAAARISQLVEFLLVIFRQAWPPYAMIIFKEAERNEVYRRMFNYYSGIFAVLGILLTAACPELFRLLVPEEYYQGYVVMPWLIGAAIVKNSGSLTNLGVLVSEKTGGISVASFVGLIANGLLGFILISGFGIIGASIGSFAASLVVTSIMWRYSVRRSDVRFDTKTIVAVLICYILSSIMLLLVACKGVGVSGLLLRLGITLLSTSYILWKTMDKPVLYFFIGMSKRAVSALPGKG
ncbi:MAG: oligosaccharide flippase family protein [Desulfatiglans sp.]|nr:oligosaccharide flippase family protein [Desulfatiglans sp.]